MDYSKVVPSESRMVSNTLWNLMGQGLPLAMGVIAIPFLIDGLGSDRFGILTLAWMLIGYFSLFDFGLGRAVTKLIAEKIGNEDSAGIPALTRTALLLMGILGVVGGLAVAGLSPWLVYGVLKIPESLRAETQRAFILLACSIPFVISTTGLRGVLEAHQQFLSVNLIRVPMGVFTFFGPLMVMPFSKSLYAVLVVLFVGRVLAWCAHLVVCFLTLPGLRGGYSLDIEGFRQLLSFGGWITVSNLVGPLMVYLDRFLIGSAFSMTAVAYYTTPYEVVTKLWILPLALVGVLFPTFCTVVVQDREKTASLFGRGVNYILIVMFPIILLVVTFAYEGMAIWVGPEFAANCELVLQVLAVGVFVNSLARVPSVLIQGVGRPAIIAKLMMFELPFYLLLLWWLLGSYGIVGAALAWTIRVLVDTIVFFLVSCRVVPEITSYVSRLSIGVIASFCVLAVAMTMSGLVIRLIFVIAIFVLFGSWSWSSVLGERERKIIRRTLLFRLA